MSSKAMAWAWQMDGLKASEKLVLLRLADHANAEGCCWPGKDSLATVCAMSKRAVDMAVQSLEARGLIKVEHRLTAGGKNTSNLYFLQLDQGDLFKGAESAGVQDLQGCKSGELGVQNLQSRGAGSAPEPTTRTLKEPFLSSSGDEVQKPAAIYETKKGKRLTGVVLELFDRFWEEFSYKKGRAEAADAWLEIVQPRLKAGTLNLEHLLAAARHEATQRRALTDSDPTPKMAQGWLSGRRWEDFSVSAKRPDPADLPWYQTRSGVEAEAERRGITYATHGYSELHELMTGLISDMKAKHETVPTVLVAYRDHVMETA